jgi:Rrf2 family protein
MMSVMPKQRSATARDATAPSRVAPVSQTAEYALRAMTLIAAAPEGRATTAIEIAEQADIPAHYVSKVLRRLVQADLLSSQKGHRGGFCLTRPAAKIRFADVLSAIDQELSKNRCAFGWGTCNLRAPCPLHPAWKRLNEAFANWAATTTLADVARKQTFNPEAANFSPDER